MRVLILIGLAIPLFGLGCTWSYDDDAASHGDDDAGDDDAGDDDAGDDDDDAGDDDDDAGDDDAGDDDEGYTFGCQCRQGGGRTGLPNSLAVLLGLGLAARRRRLAVR